MFSFLASFLGHSGVLGVNEKSPKISTNTNRTKLSLCELNSTSNTLKVNINLVLCKFCKKTVRFNYFSFPYEIWAENENYNL